MPNINQNPCFSSDSLTKILLAFPLFTFFLALEEVTEEQTQCLSAVGVIKGAQ